MNDLLQAFTALTGLLLISEFKWSPQINLIVITINIPQYGPNLALTLDRLNNYVTVMNDLLQAFTVILSD